MLKYWRVLLLVVIVLASIISIGMKAFPYGRDGVEVVYIAKDSPAKNILEQGMIITKLGEEKIEGLEDWNKKTNGFTGSLELTANGKKMAFDVNETLGFNVVGIERTNLDFGLDLKGGTRIILRPEGNVSEELLEETIGVLETRANLFGLREIKFQQARDFDGGFFIQVEAAGVGNDIVDDLLSRQGQFVAKAIKPVLIEGDKASMILGEDTFEILIGNSSLEINGSRIRENDSFSLKDIEFQYVNATNDQLIFLATLFDGDDIELVYSDPQRSGVLPQGSGLYEFFFQVLISQKGAVKFADVTTGIPKFIDVNSGQEYLQSSLLLFIDGEEVSSLRIGGSLGGQLIQSPQISGSETSLEAATSEKLRLQTILKSGALPVSLSTESVDVISPTLGIGFFDAAFKAIIVAAVAVFIIIFIRYRSIKISIPLILIGISEALIILGIAATNDAGLWGIVLIINLAIVIAAWTKKHEIDIYAWFGAVLIPLVGMMTWTIDLPAIAGIIAVIGTGVDHQIIITDETLRREKKIFGIKEQMKAAFFIIVGAASTTIFAMLPLMFVGVGLVRGFAITTIVGVLVGILITRPAYARIIERVTR